MFQIKLTIESNPYDLNSAEGAENIMKSRIAVIAEYFPPRLGADRRIFELMKRLSKKYDIHFITLPPSYTLFIRKIDCYDEEKHDVSCEGMSGHRLGLPKLISRFRKYLDITFGRMFCSKSML